jgi:hypothetical protein
MKNFRLPRKKKKKYQKDNIVFKSDWNENEDIMKMMNWKPGQFRMLNWLWFYQKRKILVRNMYKAGMMIVEKEYKHLEKHHNIWKWK